MKNNKLIAVRVEVDLFNQIRELAIYTNNTLCGICESILLQTVPQRHKFIKPEVLEEIKIKLEKK
jgi:hypothetical protein